MKYFYLLIIFWTIVHCDKHMHFYKDGDQVVLWMNTVGPYPNPQETYAYFSLPFCVGTKVKIGHYHETLSEALQGVEFEFSGLDITYKDNVPAQQFCAIELNDQSYKALVYAVKNHYWYQMYIDDLPIWGTVGEIDGDHYYIWTRKKFDIGYNGNRIVEVNLTAENKERLTPDAKIPFTYEVNWKKSDIHFEDRFDKYLDSKIFKNRIHWFIIFNNFVTVIFLVGVISMFLKRTIPKDHYKCSKENDLDRLEKVPVDEYGWKQVHSEVFRPVPYLPLFSALIGSGYQLTVVTLAVIIFTILGELYTERGSILSTAIFSYAATSPINGYFSGSLFGRMGGKLWMKLILFSAFLLPLLVCGTAFFINFIAMYYHASRAIPFGSMIAVMSICTFVILPLTFVGTMQGRNITAQSNFHFQIHAFPRPIPKKKWFMQPTVILLAGGVLPFGSIVNEMHFILKSLWGYKIYYQYGLLLLVFLILTIVTISVTIVYVYFLLNAEDYRWQWASFIFAGSTAIYVYLYAFYYFLFNTEMYGLFQTIFYFGYMALFSLAVGIICGTIGYASTGILVRKLYSSSKIRQCNITLPIITISLSAIMTSFALLLIMWYFR